MTLYLSEINDKYRNGDYTNKMPSPYDLKSYSKNHIFDEDKSVKWNKEQVELKNKEKHDAIKKYREESYRLSSQLDEDIKKAIAKEYTFNEKQAEIVFIHAYQEHHSYGYGEIINCLYELCDIFEKFKKAESGE